MDYNLPRSRQRNGDRAQARRHSSGSQERKRKQRGKRGGRRRGCRGGHRRSQTKAERLSKKQFRVCSWNCASAKQRGEILEKLIHDFDVTCLQETRTHPDRPIDIPGFIVKPRYEGRGLAIIARKSLENSMSSIDLDKWCNDSRELMGIRLEKPDHRHKSLVIINAYIHQKTHGSKESWEFLEEIEDEFGDTIVVCGDFNARSKIWDTQGTNPQGLALEAALQESLLEPLATQTPTHLASRPGDSDSTIDLALISPRLITWLSAHTLGFHGSDQWCSVYYSQLRSNASDLTTHSDTTEEDWMLCRD